MGTELTEYKLLYNNTTGEGILTITNRNGPMKTVTELELNPDDTQFIHEGLTDSVSIILKKHTGGDNAKQDRNPLDGLQQ